jgi:hypothetical protein
MKLPASVWHGKLQCHFESWTVLSDNQLVLELQPDNCTDMRGVIAVAKALMPKVRTLQVFEGGVLDMVYSRACDGKTWHAYRQR